MAPRRYRILVGDAQAGFVRVLRVALQNRGCEVQVASDGLEVVSRLRRKAHDLAIVDAALPLMDGFQVVALARSICPRMAFIVTSTYDDPELRQQAAHAGAYAFITKPVDGSRLAWLVEQAAGKVGGRAAGPRRRAGTPVRSPLPVLRRLAPGYPLLLEFSPAKTARSAPAHICNLGPFSSRLISCTHDWFAVQAPAEAGAREPAALGATVTVGLGLADGWYRFGTRVLANQPDKGGVLLLALPKMITASERRRHARKPVALRVRCATAGPRSSVRQGTTTNISPGGICITAPSRIAEGSAVALWLKPNSSRERVELSGIVAWTRRSGKAWLTGVSLASGDRRAAGEMEMISRGSRIMSERTGR